ncbi:Flp family type IVb pilin, partial [Paeniglutamicibacter sp. MACA_103]|uniref:Flp family type IVb pilin n=1 Tax=Paeniglutamicibacter sp. MACA_103 TaxID=3377337 RepID=UPI003893F0F8
RNIMNTMLANIYFAMQTVGNKIRRDEKGATAVEYGIMVAGIAVVVMVAVFLIGTRLDTMFDNVGTQLVPKTT